MPVKSYMLSALKRQLGALSLPALHKVHSAEWLVWEAGAWKAGRGGAPTLQLPAQSKDGPLPHAVGGEALAMTLVRGATLVLGRAPSCDLSVNDATLSSHHLSFVTTPDGQWTVEDLGSTNGTLLNGGKLPPRVPRLLADGVDLEAGSVHFTFHTPEGLWARLKRG